MRVFFQIFLATFSCVVVFPVDAQINVTQHHNHANRDGVYVDPAFTLTSVPNITRDTNFTGTVVGNIFAQPLYVEGGPDNRAKVIVVTESNNIYALDASSGSIIWQRNVGTAVTSGLPCGTISPLGILGTPVIDLSTRALFFDAMIDGTTKKHFIYSLNVDTGATNSGWPVDVNAKATFGALTFTSSQQNQRAALAFLNGIVYVPYSGLNGDCGSYHGWVVGVQTSNPANVTSWATAATRGGIWGTGGIASDGTDVFAVTGNTTGTGGTFGQGEAIIRLHSGPIFSNATADYWAPTNWLALDNADLDLGGCGAVLIDVPGATPSQMVLALGKDQNAYLVNRGNLGGISAPVATFGVSSTGSTPRGQAAVTYRTSLGTYFALRTTTSNGTLSAFKVSATSPPVISSAWSLTQNGLGSPFVTSSDGTSNMIVWTIGSQGDQRLHGYNADNGAVVYSGGGTNELMTSTRYWNTGIVARGSIYMASDNKVYAFRLPVYTPVLTNLGFSSGTYSFAFTNIPGKIFSVYASTNLVTPLASWTLLGTATEVSAGQYQFSDPTAGASSNKFYRVTAP